MPKTPVFFLPFLSPDLQEASYAHLAERCDRSVPALDSRVYSVTFERDGVVWIAMVGECLKGHRPGLMKHRKTGRQMEDPAMVLAIFPDVPYCIVTDAGASRGSHFENPLYVTPIGTKLFSLPASP
jgi:hypothetical protein